jgi:cyclopropane fatty-acyl-phospholipid synthase-like methyltransferase
LAEQNYEKWEDVYRRGGEGPYPWDLGRPRDFLVQLLERGMIEGDRALDTCCGLGTNGLYLAEKGFNVTGIDISEKAVKIANRKAEKTRKSENIDFKVHSFMDMDFEPGSFDFVLDIGCFHHVAKEDRQKFIENVRRVLRPGGRYLLMCFSDRMGPAWNHFSEQQVRGLFSGHFNIMILEEISSVEGDGVTRYFYVSLMERPSK